MADEAKDDLVENVDAEAELKKAKKKKMMIIGGAIFAIILIAAIYFLFIKQPSENVGDEAEKHSSHGGKSPQANSHGAVNGANSAIIEDVYYDLDNFVINLNSSGGRSRFLKMTVTLHIKSDVDVNIISKKIPIIRDNFQFYLRELRPADLEGSREMSIVKEELLIRINKILSPIVVQDILFKEILVN